MLHVAWVCCLMSGCFTHSLHLPLPEIGLDCQHNSLLSSRHRMRPPKLRQYAFTSYWAAPWPAGLTESYRSRKLCLLINAFASAKCQDIGEKDTQEL